MKHTCLFLLLAMPAVLILASGPAPKPVRRSLKEDKENILNKGLRPSLNERTCIKYSSDTCVGRNSGDYLACDPLCQEGVYISCSNGNVFLSNCNTGWYFGFTLPQKLVYDPILGSCEYKTPYCPRELDQNVIG